MAKRLKSVFTDDLDHCIICGRTAQRHHIFYGVSINKARAEQDGFIIPLCLEHHTGNKGIHHDPELNLLWKKKAQAEYEKTHSRIEFMQRYGKNYL